VDLVEAQLDARVLQFDGRVLELFGGLSATSDWRRHAAFMAAVVVTGPDKHGVWSVAFQPPQQLTTAFRISEAEFQALQPILEALQTAGVQVSINP
jgi:hypothetical protein